MHSSRMRTGRSLTVCWCLLPGGVCLVWGGCAWSWGGSGIPACTEADPPPWTESQTPVETLPWPNFVAAGNYNFTPTTHQISTFSLPPYLLPSPQPQNFFVDFRFGYIKFRPPPESDIFKNFVETSDVHRKVTVSFSCGQS